MTSPAGKSAFLQKAVAFLAELRSDTERTVYISEAAAVSGQQVSAITSLVKDKMDKNKYYRQKEEEKKLIRGEVKRDAINPEAIKYPTEEKAERGIIAFLFHSPDRLADVETKLNEEDFPTEFNRRVYKFVRERIKSGNTVDISSAGSEFTAEEMGRISGICKQGDMLPYSLPRLDEYINVLIRFKEKSGQKPVEEMTDEELLAYAQAKKKRRT